MSYYQDLTRRRMQTLSDGEGGKIMRLIEGDGTAKYAWHVDDKQRVLDVHRDSMPGRIIPLPGAVRHDMLPAERGFLAQPDRIRRAQDRARADRER